MERRSSIQLLPLVLLCIALALFAYNVKNNFFLGDDSFISFRYAKHLVLGNGLVWNEGYAVEGYTNFLWVLLVALGMQLGFEPEWFAPSLSIAAGVVLLFAFLGWLFKRHGSLSLSVWVPIFILCISRTFTAWTTGGLETMLHAALIFGGIVSIVSAHDDQYKTPWGSAIFFALATLTRPDSIVFAFAAGCALLFDSLFGKRPLRTVVYWTFIYFFPVLLHVAWRYWYYGDFLPNTFHAKVAGLWFDQAVNYFHLFHRYYYFGWFLPFVVLGVFSKFKYEARFFFFTSLVYLSYIIYVGGDRFEFRFLVVLFPYVYWLTVEGIKIFAYGLLGIFCRKYLQHAIAFAVVLALLGTTYHGSTIEIPKDERHGVANLRGINKYATSRTEQGLFLRRLIDEGYFPADLEIALGGAGAVPYYSMVPVLDRRGLNNIEIARMPIKKRGRIAHEHDVPLSMLVDREIVVFDILNRIQHTKLDRLNMRKYHHDGEQVRMRALQTPYGYLIFATFVSDEKLKEIFPRLDLVLPDWELEQIAKARAEMEKAEADEVIAEQMEDSEPASSSASSL